MFTTETYLLHFEKPIGSKKHSAQHYFGSSKDVEARLRMHRTGTSGVSIVDAFFREGIRFALARVWRGGRAYERMVKNRKKSGAYYCPYCQGEREFEPWTPDVEYEVEEPL